jgi:hypothetical protein
MEIMLKLPWGCSRLTHRYVGYPTDSLAPFCRVSDKLDSESGLSLALRQKRN